ncbi:hypothetical protein [Haloarcula marismortui]|uniref:Uncharacterized protein n=1 Tax=Haloarcula marismortui ATCC 33799 TaxID=662475 RepID=M0JZH9_9EURY|nr:hypothetical protein [Haloarcula californiae]EMA12985.1 hypothetical protein C435_16695 [Haloarcula californiae ATCC 33799]
MTERTRRQLLAGIGTSLTLATAGCGGNSGSGGSNSSADNSGDGLSGGGADIFDEFSFEEYTLNISLATTDGYDEIVAFDSDGKQFASTSVTPSAGQVSLDFADYSPGEYRFAAVNSDDDTVVSEVTEVLEPNIELVDWQTASEAGMYSPEDRSAVTDIVFTIKNTGNAPGKLRWVGYESEQFIPEWSEDGEPEPVGYNGDATPESQLQSLSDSGRLAYRPSFKSDRNLPISVYPSESTQLVDADDKWILIAGMGQDDSVLNNEDTAGWSVQQGVEYDFTVSVGGEYSGQSSLTKTVKWERMGKSEVMTNQPADSLITTRRGEGSS